MAKYLPQAGWGTYGILWRRPCNVTLGEDLSILQEEEWVRGTLAALVLFYSIVFPE